MTMRTAPLRAQWVEVADRDGHVHLEERWVAAPATSKEDQRTVPTAKQAA